MKSEPQISPAAIMADLFSYQRSAALKAAIELDVFSQIARGHQTAEALAHAVAAAPRGVRILCDYLTVDGLLTKADGKYALSPQAAAFLDRRSPAYLGEINVWLTADELITYFLKAPADYVRKGGTTFNPGGTVTHDNRVWVKFARGMAPLMQRPAQRIAELLGVESAGPLDVLDVAASHGAFGLAIARRNKDARITALDWGAVLEVASENASRAGLSSQFQTLPGDAFTTDLGRNRDLVLVTNFLHHFATETCIDFLRRAHACLKPGGRVAVLDMMPNADRVTPPGDAAFAFTMLATTEAGDAFTVDEHESMLRAAGFHEPKLYEIDPPAPGRLMVATA